eukprot:8456006-Lingulodinium_polyedra.AAC.1
MASRQGWRVGEGLSGVWSVDEWAGRVNGRAAATGVCLAGLRIDGGLGSPPPRVGGTPRTPRQ